MTAPTRLPHARPPWCCRVVLLALAAHTGILHAQAIPGSGELLQQTPRPATAAPSATTGLTIEEPASQRVDDTTTFLVQHIEISGNTLLPTAELRRLVSPSEGKRLNFSHLEQLATLITRRYQDRGYLLSRAYIPPQTIKGGTVRIAVLEARFGAVSLKNTSKVSEALLNSYFTALRPGQPVTEGPLERSLLLASDVPGAAVSSTLAPGAAPGTTELEVSAAPGQSYGGYAALDDAGNRYTGRTRASGTFDLDDPLHQGDVLSVTGLTAGADFTYGRLGYQALLDDGAGTSLGGAISGLYYHLGDGASELHAHGTAQVATLSLMQPIIRSTAGNLFLQIGVDHKLLRDEIEASSTHSDRNTTDLTVSLAADQRDAGGISNASLGLAVGGLQFENAAAESADAAAARTRGTYDKLTLSLARLQSLSPSNSLYLAFNGQWADKNLDSSEQFFLGGLNSVRAYDTGVVGGAQGATLSAELRHNLGSAWQALAFADSGTVEVYKDPLGAGENRATLFGAGAGLNWVGPHGWTATGSVATPFGNRSALAGDSASTRVWIEIRKNFGTSSKPR